jgi:alkylated DNA repair dioxygenase AlkB
MNSYYDLPDPNCWITQDLYIPREIRLDGDQFEKLWSLHPPNRVEGKLAGKDVQFHRYTAGFGDNYGSSNLYKYKSFSLEETDYYNYYFREAYPFFRNILEFTQQHSEQNYQQLLVNWYEDGTDYIGYHNDKGRFVPNSSIYSFSYGEERDFYVRTIPKISCVNPNFKLQLKMPHNSMLVMGGNMQNFYQHSVPKRTSKRNPLGRRINITLRLFRDDID